ncbi:hypothetical protein [Streptomyces sp. NPDC046887]|uniref:hypothetical protein n=1 Tax=Streptomyces sp. NPDC046887 TaxID=3155472 RepID=UPI0034011CD4
MNSRVLLTALTLTSTAAAGGLLTASPATAGGIGDFLSPAFGTSCANDTGTHLAGATSAGSGTADANVLGLPLGSALNQCGGADLPADTRDVCEMGNSMAEGGLVAIDIPVNLLSSVNNVCSASPV